MQNLKYKMGTVNAEAQFISEQIQTIQRLEKEQQDLDRKINGFITIG